MMMAGWQVLILLVVVSGLFIVITGAVTLLIQGKPVMEGLAIGLKEMFRYPLAFIKGLFEVLPRLFMVMVMGVALVGGLASLFSMIASIIHFQIGMALLFCFLTWLCWVIFMWLKKRF